MQVEAQQFVMKSCSQRMGQRATECPCLRCLRYWQAPRAYVLAGMAIGRDELHVLARDVPLL